MRAKGEAGHAGTTPLQYRRDALRAICALMEKLYHLAEGLPQLRLTVGKLDVLPSSINTVPGDAVITVDVRHVDGSQLDACVSTATDAVLPIAPPPPFISRKDTL